MWQLLYAGQCDSYKNRLRDHEVWPSAVALGATHVLAHVNANALARLAEERDLIRRWNPPLNQQHRTRPLPQGLGSIPFGVPPS
jgi:hypothetical protein